MEYTVGVRKLVELIFVKKFQITAEDSSIPTCLLTNDFPLKIRCVLLTKQAIVAERWKRDFDDYISKMLSSHKNYLISVLFVSLMNHVSQNTVFDSFITVCSLVRFFGQKTFQHTGINYFELNPDIIMEFYDSVWKTTFRKCGGFRRLVEYIHHHKYLAWNLDMNDLASLDNDPSAHVNALTSEKLKNEIENEQFAWKQKYTFKFDIDELRISSVRMARKVLSTTSVKLFNLKKEQDSNRREDASHRNEKAKTAEEKTRIEADLKLEPLEEVRPGGSTSNSDSKTRRTAQQKENIPEYDHIIQAVMKHNHSKSTGHATSGNTTLKKADVILKRIEDTIRSLIDVLDEYDNE